MDHCIYFGTFTDPVVIAQPTDGFETSVVNGDATAVVRNVSTSSFEVQLYRGDSTGGSIAGDVGYIVVEKGNHTLPDGTQIQAGSVDISNMIHEVVTPVVFFTQLTFHLHLVLHQLLLQLQTLIVHKIGFL